MRELANKVLQNSILESRLVDEMLSIGRPKKVSASQVIISPGSTGNEMPIVLQGLLKVMRKDNHDNEVFLYFLEGGETCAMSITCCIEGKKTAFQVVAEEDSVLWMIPMNHIDTWLQQYKSFRKFVFDSYQTRFEELLETIDSVVFSKLDERLFKYLLDKKQASGSFEIHKTHEQIANELSTSRVVVSRLLKQLEKEGKIEQHRNLIVIL